MTTTAPSNTADAPRYRIEAVTDDVLDCEVCGLDLDRNSTYRITDLTCDDVFHAGTTCGARILGTTVARFTSEADRQAAAEAATDLRRDELAELSEAETDARDAVRAGGYPRRTGSTPTALLRSTELPADTATAVLATPFAARHRQPAVGPNSTDTKWARYVLIEAYATLRRLDRLGTELADTTANSR